MQDGLLGSSELATPSAFAQHVLFECFGDLRPAAVPDKHSDSFQAGPTDVCGFEY